MTIINPLRTFGAIKTADETRTSTTTPTDDSHLNVTISAAGTYRLRAVLYANVVQGAGITLNFVTSNVIFVPSRVSLGYFFTVTPQGQAVEVTGQGFAMSNTTPSLIIGGDGYDTDAIRIRIGLDFDDTVIATAAGSMKIQWAQTTSMANTCTLNKNSFISMYTS